MKLKLLALALLLTAVQNVYGQFREYIGRDDRSEVILDMKILPDGGAIMVGYSTALRAPGHPDGQYDYSSSDILAVRIDNNGNIVWNRRFGETNADDKLYKVIIDNNGDYVAVGVVKHIPWYAPSPFPGYASIFRFDAATGNVSNSNFVHLPTIPDQDKGSIYEDVVQLTNGDFVAVGANDCRPSTSDGLVTCFDGTFGVKWNRIFPVSGTDAFHAVAQENDRIFIGGTHQATYYDIQMLEMNAAGGTVWHKTYAYTAPSGSNSNLVNGLQIENGELMLLTSVADDWVATNELKAGIMRLDMTGNPISLYLFNDGGHSHSNAVAADYTSNSNAYYAINPANMLVHIPVPYINNPNFDLTDAQLSIIDPTNGGVTDVKRLVHTGEQMITAINLSGTESYYAGVSRNDPIQPGDHDIFFVRTDNGLPSNSGDCVVEDDNLFDDSRQVTDGNLNFTPDPNYTTPTPNLVDYNEEMSVVKICDEEPDPEPCDIEDITWCSSLASPYTYAFNTVTNPAGANVRWNFGDGSPTVNSTAGTTVYHTYAAPGQYTVCVEQLDALGDPCDELCIELCVADNGRAMKPGKSQQSSLLDPGAKNTGLAVGDLYPNPTDGTLNIPVTTQTGEDVSIRIIRMDGVVVYDAKETLQEGKQTLKVTLGNLTPGNYMCEIRDNKTRNTRMFTKQ